MLKKGLLLSLVSLIITLPILKAPWGNDDEVAPAYHGYAPSSSSSTAAAALVITPSASPTSQTPCLFLCLPNELIELIFQFLEVQYIYSATAQTSKILYKKFAANNFLPHRLIEERIASPISCGHHAQGPHDIVSWWNEQQNISADGMHKMVGSWPRKHVKSTSSREIEFTLEQSTLNGISCAAFAPNSQNIAAGTGDGHVLLWNIETGNQILSSRNKHVRSVAFIEYSPSGNKIASLASLDDQVIIWDSETLRVEQNLCHKKNKYFATNDSHACPVSLAQVKIKFLPNNGNIHDCKLASFSFDTVIIWTITKEMVASQKFCTNKINSIRQNPPVSAGAGSLSFSKDGQLKTTCDPFGKVQIFETNSGERLHCILRHGLYAFLGENYLVIIHACYGGEMWKIAPTLEEIDQEIATEKQAKAAFLKTIKPGSRVCCR